MKSFLSEVTHDLISNYSIELEDLLIVVPNKRASILIKHEITKQLKTVVFSPKIVSIEEFIEEISGIKKISDFEAISELYCVYKNEIDSPENFENFISWGRTILSDFNELDRHLADCDKVFNHLNAIKLIESDHWSINSKSNQVTNYVQLWNDLNSIYIKLNQKLSEENRGYQGGIYRKAAKDINTFVIHEKHVVFLGFNALNKAEEVIIKTLINKRKASIYWDADDSFLTRTFHDAGLFLRQHMSDINNSQKPLKWINNNYSEIKNITIYKAVNSLDEAQIASQILQTFDKEKQKSSALVLADEKLLIPMINLVPVNIEQVNITMGMPINSSSSYNFFETLLTIIEDKSNKIYHKSLKTFFSNSISQFFFQSNTQDSNTIIKYINTKNLTYVSCAELMIEFSAQKEKLKLLFGNWDNNLREIINQFIIITDNLYKSLNKAKEINASEIQVLFHIKTIFERLSDYNNSYNHFNSIKSLHIFFREYCSKITLDYKGNPLSGLQIMGLLETRTLDFENIIITSLNEGVLPGGKSQNSFLPHELKIKNNLPTYREKDAIYSYHFYRLLSRAKNIHLIYNSETDTLNGGEKSRFITQIEIEGIHNITYKESSKSTSRKKQSLLTIPKTDSIIQAINKISESGYSPSALTNYIRNPIDFYKQKIIKVAEEDKVNETIASNTLGTIIHKTLEDLYKPYINNILTLDILKNCIKRIDEKTSYHFKNEYDNDVLSGKNNIVFEVAKRFIQNFIYLEIKEIKNGREIIIKALEFKLSTHIAIKGIDSKIKIYGEIDRIDTYDGITRIIDYKTGLVKKSDVTISDWNLMLSDYKKYSKSFQLLTYAYLFINSSQGITFTDLETGIYSFRNLKEGFNKFTFKPTSKAKDAKSKIDTEIITEFEIQLKKLILEIHDINVPFVEKKL